MNIITYLVPTDSFREFPKSVSVGAIRDDGVVVHNAIYFPKSVINFTIHPRYVEIKVAEWFESKRLSNTGYKVFEY